MWSELRKKENDMHQSSKDNLAFEFFFEERVWHLASLIKTFKLDKLQKRVQARMHNRME